MIHAREFGQVAPGQTPAARRLPRRPSDPDRHIKHHPRPGGGAASGSTMPIVGRRAGDRRPGGRTARGRPGFRPPPPVS